MDAFGKLFRKITKKDRKILLVIIGQLARKDEAIWRHAKKVGGSDLYRLRKGRFRFVFHLEGREIIIDSVRLKNKNTYKDL